MRVSVVSDIHGNFEDLARVAGESECLVVLGDLLDYVDYADPARGVLGTIFGADNVSRLARMRAAGDFAAYHALDRHLWSTISNPEATLDEVVAEQYVRAIAALRTETYLTLGNVDVEPVWRAIAPPRLAMLDGEVIEIDGVRLGFVGGGALRALPPPSPWRSFDRTYESFQGQVSALGAFDVLCTHVPPKISGMRHDTVADRDEMYGPGLLELINDRQPKFALSGHVHHPRRADVRVGATMCVNVGYFKRNPTAFVFDTDSVRAV